MNVLFFSLAARTDALEPLYSNNILRILLVLGLISSLDFLNSKAFHDKRPRKKRKQYVNKEKRSQKKEVCKSERLGNHIKGGQHKHPVKSVMMAIFRIRCPALRILTSLQFSIRPTSASSTAIM